MHGVGLPIGDSPNRTRALSPRRRGRFLRWRALEARRVPSSCPAGLRLPRGRRFWGGSGWSFNNGADAGNAHRRIEKPCLTRRALLRPVTPISNGTAQSDSGGSSATVKRAVLVSPIRTQAGVRCIARLHGSGHGRRWDGARPLLLTLAAVASSKPAAATDQLLPSPLTLAG